MNLSLDTIGLGVASEKFSQELIKVIQNISDPNTEAKAKRKIILEFEIEPTTDDRQMCNVLIKSKSKLQENTPFPALIAVGVDPRSGEVAAEDHTPHQQTLFAEQEKGSGKITAINS